MKMTSAISRPAFSLRRRCESGADLIGHGDGNDALIERRAATRGRFHDEAAEQLASAFDEKFHAGVREREAGLADVQFGPRHETTAVEAFVRRVEGWRFEPAVAQLE